MNLNANVIVEMYLNPDADSNNCDAFLDFRFDDLQQKLSLPLYDASDNQSPRYLADNLKAVLEGQQKSFTINGEQPQQFVATFIGDGREFQFRCKFNENVDYSSSYRWRKNGEVVIKNIDRSNFIHLVREATKLVFDE